MTVIASRVSPARACAFEVVRRVFERGAYADRALAAEAGRAALSSRDRALAMRIAFGTVQRRATLDHVVEQLAERDVGKLTPAVLSALRVGLFQLLFLDGIAEHAAVNESVELAKLGGSAGSRLVNAVLRRALREGPAILSQLDDSTPERAAILHSVPVWLAEQWWRELGGDEARALLERINDPAESALRVNTLVSSPEVVVSRLPVAARPAPGLPEAVVLEGPFDVWSSDLWREGAVMAQSTGSMRVARMVGSRAGERVLDLCAAPGGKTTHIAALQGATGEIVAVERHPGRAQALQQTCERMHATGVEVKVADAAEISLSPAFDRVLVDPPCSGLGTLQSRPDVRWRASPHSIAELAELQLRILEAGAAATSPGGVLVYSVCTVSQAEGEAVIERFIAQHEEFELDERLQLLPHRDGTDGFFIGRLRRLDL
jgi:16S rRNA (cytosine967-C5)-methyltransferase